MIRTKKTTKSATKTALLVGSVLMGLLLSACGGADGGSVTPPVAGGVTPPTASTSADIPEPSAPEPSIPATSEVAAVDAVTASSQATTNATPRPPEYYEKDPGVKTVRLHFLGTAKAVNARSMNIPELQRTSTKEWLKKIEPYLRKEYGMQYLGPIPFTTTSVSTLAPDYKQVVYCVLDPGWLRNPKTGEPTAPRLVTRQMARVKKFGSTWRVVEMMRIEESCPGVTIREERFT